MSQWSWPRQDIRALARAAVSRPGAHRWFVAWMPSAIIPAGYRDWILSSRDAPRWV